MSYIKKHAEIIFSLIIGIVSLFIGIIILLNVSFIHKLAKGGKADIHIYNVWDFINAFFGEIIRIMSRFIGQFPVFSAIFIIVFGIALLWIGYLLFMTTKYDYDISIFFLIIGILFFIITIILMTQVYGFAAIIFVVPFVVHTGYIVYKDELNHNHRKEHYLWIICAYGISYLITQIALYGRIESHEIAMIDILSVNAFFIVMWILAQISIWNFLFLRRSLPLTKAELGEEMEFSRTDKNGTMSQTKEQLREFQERTQEFTHRTRRSIDLEKMRNKRDKFKNTIKEKIDIQDDDIPNWMKRPKWIKPGIVELICGIILFLFTLLELNNRNALFASGEWELSQTSYVIEWITLFLLLIVIIIYIITTLTHFLRGKFYYVQMFMISILFFKLLTEFVNIMIHGLLLSIFITPILLIMLVAVIIAFVIQMRTPVDGQ
ncbi:membrane spanning protein [Staphylococcus piscifermentans]|uniref:Uncharacterized protein n=1 Tax=Staphylococcus piscifermentans TaxID=70258 RepID=A0A239U8S0_9STAP|nr:hypothetical protein [Staphylococcus piscifermentans]RTX84226.1 hypothetical protein CD139_07015 [Staphylococcus piscifermentans]GEP85057.1 hypothetical protein SPI02_16420 [Staphylococcus piscifermentans]SNV06306.1 membrane spanning protein [Staphylococcus piscifermentans]